MAMRLSYRPSKAPGSSPNRGYMPSDQVSCRVTRSISQLPMCPRRWALISRLCDSRSSAKLAACAFCNCSRESAIRFTPSAMLENSSPTAFAGMRTSSFPVCSFRVASSISAVGRTITRLPIIQAIQKPKKDNSSSNNSSSTNSRWMGPTTRSRSMLTAAKNAVWATELVGAKANRRRRPVRSVPSRAPARMLLTASSMAALLTFSPARSGRLAVPANKTPLRSMIPAAAPGGNSIALTARPRSARSSAAYTT